jgi:hypothetical protein
MKTGRETYMRKIDSASMRGGVALVAKTTTMGMRGETMRSIPLRDFQREGVKALGAGVSAEPWLLSGREQEFVLLPVSPDNRTAMLDLAEGLAAVMTLRQDQARAVAAGLDGLTMDEIDAEIGEARKALKRRKRTA